MNALSAFGKFIEPLKRRVFMMLARGVVRAIDDANGLQRMQIECLRGELLDSVERFQDYGFTSVPLEGAEMLAGFLNGNRDHGIIVRVDDRRYRLNGLAGGEVAIYTDEGDKVHFKRGRIIDVSTDTLNISADTAVNITSPIVDCSAILQGVTVKGTDDVLAGSGEISGKSHVHVENDNGGPTEAPQ